MAHLFSSWWAVPTLSLGDGRIGNPSYRPYTSSLRAPIRVRSRSAKRAASNGFLNVSLMDERSKLVEPPSSGSRAIKITSAYSSFRRKFWQICRASVRPIEKSTMMQSGWKLSA